MTQINSLHSSGPVAMTPEETKLRRATQELEGVFVQELFKAMRDTVPEGGIMDGGPGEEMFSDMMDQQISAEAATGWDRGIGAALFRQLRPLLAGAAAAPQPDAAPEGSQ